MISKALQTTISLTEMKCRHLMHEWSCEYISNVYHILKSFIIIYMKFQDGFGTQDSIVYSSSSMLVLTSRAYAHICG